MKNTIHPEEQCRLLIACRVGICNAPSELATPDSRLTLATIPHANDLSRGTLMQFIESLYPPKEEAPEALH